MTCNYSVPQYTHRTASNWWIPSNAGVCNLQGLHPMYKFAHQIILCANGSIDNSRISSKKFTRNTTTIANTLDSSHTFWHINPLYVLDSNMPEVKPSVLIDADLQNPPECIALLLDKWREGYQVVCGIRQHRKENFLKRASYWIFYRLLNKIANISTPLDAGDFCVLDRQVVNHLNALPERNRFMRGLRAWAGFSQIGVTYERQARFSGERKYTFRHLLKLAIPWSHQFLDPPTSMGRNNWRSCLYLFVFRHSVLRYSQDFRSAILGTQSWECSGLHNSDLRDSLRQRHPDARAWHPGAIHGTYL